MLSSYEEARQANIARNKAMLASLGIEKQSRKSVEKRPPRKKKDEPSRRSSRLEQVAVVRAQIQLILDDERDKMKEERQNYLREVRERNKQAKQEREELAAMRKEEADQRKMAKLIQEHEKMIKKQQETDKRRKMEEEAQRIKEEERRRRHVVVLKLKPDHKVTLKSANLSKHLQELTKRPCEEDDDDVVYVPKKEKFSIKLQTHEFEVYLDKGDHGLCIEFGIVNQSVKVNGFREPYPGVKGPAEASGRIAIGDELIGVNGHRVANPGDIERFAPILKSGHSVTLRFRRISLSS